MATQKENNLIIGTNIKRLLKEHIELLPPNAYGV